MRALLALCSKALGMLALLLASAALGSVCVLLLASQPCLAVGVLWATRAEEW